jgi:hypothetical protein
VTGTQTVRVDLFIVINEKFEYSFPYMRYPERMWRIFPDIAVNRMETGVMRMKKCQLGANSVIVIIAALSIVGCGGNTPEIKEITGYGLIVTRESRPEEIAALLIAGLDNQDKELLGKLVAVDDAVNEMKKIYQKHPRKTPPSEENAVRMTVTGWQMTYSFFRPEETVVLSETTDENRATVTLSGRNKTTGQTRQISVNFLREKGWWKIRPGLVVSGIQ